MGGYYTLVAGQLDHHEATAEISKGLSHHFPIPVAILARLAVDAGQQNHGTGAPLLNDAFMRVVRASEQVAVRAVVVHAINENASSFYERFGFSALSATPRTLMIPSPRSAHGRLLGREATRGTRADPVAWLR